MSFAVRFLAKLIKFQSDLPVRQHEIIMYFPRALIWLGWCVAVPLAHADDGSRSTSPGSRIRAEVEWVAIPRPAIPRAPLDASENSVAADRQETAQVDVDVSEPLGGWQILSSDRTFYQTLLRWARMADWQLVWEAERDFAIDAQVSLHGSFLQALEASMRALQDTDYPLQASVNTTTRVVRIRRYALDGERR